MKILCYLSSQDLNIYQYRTFRYREVKYQLIFSILNHHKLLIQIHINDQVEPTKLENIRIAKQLQKINRGDFTFGNFWKYWTFKIYCCAQT